jgi:GWxTD domain-containing protein
VVATQCVGARSLRAILDVKQFHSPEQGNYIEVYMQFLARSVHFSGDSITGRSTDISIQIVVSQDSAIVQFDKYKIVSKFDNNDLVDDIYSIKRFALEAGSYQIEYEFVDQNNIKDTIRYEQDFEVNSWKYRALFSDIQLIENLRKTETKNAFTKNGFEMLPRLMPYYNVESERFVAYLELYNTNENEELPKFAVRYYIKDNDNGRKLENFTITKIYKSANVIPFIINMNIMDLSSGNYDFVIEYLDQNENVQAKKSITFDRFNPLVSDLIVDYSQIIVDPRFFESIPDDSIYYFLESLSPISSQADIAQIYKLMGLKDLELTKKYFQSYWLRTNPISPTDAWIKYKALVISVQKEYGTSLLPGFKSDRGRVFLQFGPPNARIQRPNEPEEYPYEIWQYYKIDNFSNRRFVFFNPMNIGNEYILLHSDMQGEIFNNRWVLDLSRTGMPVRTSRVNDEGIMEGGQRR